MASFGVNADDTHMRPAKFRVKTIGAVIATGVLLLASSNPAFAFRCKSRIIQDGMHQAEVIRLCGDPVSVRDMGYVIRAVSYGRRSLISRNRHHNNGYGHYRQEVLVTEMLFNFGPRKLMRQLVFEGGILTSIRTMGYGYNDNNKQ